MKKTLAVLLLLILPAFASAQGFLDCPTCATASSAIGDDGDAYFICIYTGLGNGYATVAADGNLLFESPDNATANTHIECDAAIAADGSRNGTIDVSVAACNTATEVLNIVNKPETDFRCVLHAGLGTDDLDISGTGWLKAVTDADCSPPDGCKLYADTDTALKISNVLASAEFLKGSKYTSGGFGGVGRQIVSNAYLNTRALLAGVSTLSTYGAGTSVFNVYSVKGEYTPSYAPVSGAPPNIGFVYSETITTLWGPVTNGATTVFKTFGTCDTAATACGPEWGAFGLLGREDERLIVRITNSNALASTSLQITGVQQTTSDR